MVLKYVTDKIIAQYMNMSTLNYIFVKKETTNNLNNIFLSLICIITGSHHLIYL